ncbi:MAG: aquaporin Z [Candidatus Paceibacteria bacterium]|jgi:aquaporin Z
MQQKLVAEAFGTFTLALAVLTSISVLDPMLATPVVAALVLGLFVYSIGSVSGSHINPAVTAGLWSIRKINTPDAIKYIIAQCAGALAAFFVAGMFVSGLALGMVPENMMDFWAELIGMTLFTFGIAAVVYGKVADTASGLVIGGSLLLGLILAVYLGSAGILNPAVGLAVGSVSFSYIAGAVAGSMIGMNLYRYLTS